MPYLRPKELFDLASHRVRYCSDCLGDGFHSPLTQIRFISRCPFHQTFLRITCVHCGALTPLYMLTKEMFERPFGCPHCGHVLATVQPQGATQQPSRYERAESHREVVKWLKRRMSTTFVELDTSEWVRCTVRPTSEEERVDHLVYYWNHVLDAAPPTDSTDLCMHSYRLTHACVAIRVQRCRQQIKMENAWLLYRSIRRFIIRRMLRSHRRCIQNMYQTLRQTPLGHRHTGQMCPYAHALMLWRMHWERLPLAQMLCQRRKAAAKRHRTPSLLSKVSRSIPFPVQLRIFALECLAAFEQCLEEAEQTIRNDVSPVSDV